ncbi:OmpA family protein [Paraflavitalea sp. CAU 1676]|uniref:OmpA family protein n=1 Tax=Paraflavitalea sp. CAU 1676 TaxID=3032598 RepID=UPI0023DC3BDA|nr:OmpA family protein [Paraflavitalea sp. CAU 1676]MDF2189381.1 OmpA family protein [Paraflavitalea sp. CAU 1676]
MASKKYTGLFGLLCLLTSGAFAQIGGSYDVQDSSVIPSKRLPQHSEFMANNYPFPAKPRNSWEIGIKGGLANVIGDVRSRFGWGAGLHVRKALGYVFSLRGDFNYLNTKGMNFQASHNYQNNPAWNAYPRPVAGGPQHVFYNYKTNIYDASLQAVFTLNNIRFHRAKSGFNVYAFAGLGGTVFDAKVDALDANGANYSALFTQVYNKYAPTSFPYKDRKDIRSDLKDGMDGDYETEAQEDNGQAKLFGEPFRPNLNFGLGMQFKLSKKLSLGIEDKVTLPKTDLLDGQQWQENGIAATAQTRDMDLYNFFSVGLNFAIGGSKAVEPLWWLNPLDYAYNEINKPRHMKLPKPILDDSDGDGVTDQFDNEPNTPAGAPVDVRGVSRDTDGDGVPDYKDKELVTPTQCQPVDADGVGKCPPPACCDELARRLDSLGPISRCNIGSLPSVTFKGKSVTLSNDAKALLASAAQQIRNNPACKIAVVGYCSTNKSEQQLSWDRVNSVITYLVEKEGISSDRFIFKYGETGGECTTVDLRDGTGEEGPNTVPAPHPNLRRRG